MTQLIPIAYIQEVTPLSNNADKKKLDIGLEEAQDELQEILGGEFYEQIESQYTANPLTLANLSTDNNTLYDDYIKKYLAWQAYFFYLGSANSESTPTGEREFIEEHSTVVSDIKMYSKENRVRGKVNKYKYRLINFLILERKKDSTKYPLWVDTCKEYFSFAITAVDKKSDLNLRVNKSVTDNE